MPYGNDTIDAQDGEADQIDCGIGTDTAYVDAADVVSATCENVVKNGDAQSAGAGGPSGAKAGVGGLPAALKSVKLGKALTSGFTVSVTTPAKGKVKVVATAKGKAATSSQQVTLTR